MDQQSGAPIKGRYHALASAREPFLRRARDHAKVTIPTLIPEEGANEHTLYPTPYQSLGARGVNNLASKLLLALLPPNSPFFRLKISDFDLAELTGDVKMRAEVEEALATIERTVMDEVETMALRVQVFEALKHLIVAGNVLLFMSSDGRARVFSINQYVTSREPNGDVIEIILKEEAHPAALPEEIREACSVNESCTHGGAKTVEIYTRVKRDGNKWSVIQEINGVMVPGSEGSYPLDKSPWLALRFITVHGEDYGRAYVEEYFGDLLSLEGLQKAIVQGAAAAAKLLVFVNPNGVTDRRVVERSSNGDVVAGNADDVTLLHLDKSGDFRVAFQAIQEITERLSFAFLLNSAVQRNGERVTAEEIRYMAGELEDALGGIYSVLSQDFQLPLVKVLMHRLRRKGRIPELPKDSVQPAITTGIEALGRGHDLNKLSALIQHLSVLGPEVLSQYLNVGDYITRTGTSLGIDMDGLVRSEEEVQQMQQQAQMAAMAQQIGPEAVKQIGQQMAPQEQQQ